MNTENKQLLREMRRLSRVAPDADSTARAIARARGAALRAATSEAPRSRRRILVRGAWLGVAATLLLLVAGERWLAGLGPSRALAFGQVQERVNRTKSVQYVQRRKDRTKQNQLAPQEMRKVMILGAHRMREEVTTTTAGDPLPEGEIWASSPEEYVMIHNYGTGKFIALFPKKRTFNASQTILGIDVDSGEVKESKLKAIPQADFYQRLRDVPTDKAKRLPGRQIDGREAIGFQVVEKLERRNGVSTSTRTYWVDAASKLPVRIEISLQHTDPMMVDTEFVQSDFVFDAPIDESLFSTDPPPGYRPQ